MMSAEISDRRLSSDDSMQRVLSPRDTSILSLIARVSGSKARQRDVFDRNFGQLESPFAQEVARALVDEASKDVSSQAIQTAKAMNDWVATKIARFSANPTTRKSKLMRASGSSSSRIRSRVR